ncbi:thioredoxin domain-containing protein [Nocardia sp. CT2-14]|uniref:Thioredoxin domain-containing protein n=1 Tax=Nocardia aurantiaca TaxID=2675850 RepID=A0A6I3L0U2_9NOCA|nr:thioredoxin domain-containing protein [Nocardia aurantiaca]
MSNKPGDRNNPLAKAARADRNRKIAIQVGVAAVLVGLVAAIGIGLAMRKSDDEKSKPSATATSFAPTVTHDASAGAVPPNVTSGGAIRIGNPDAKAKIQIVADLQCPACKMFEGSNSDALSKAVQSGSATIDYSIISFLDRASNGNQYSTRAANAAYVVAASDPSKFQAWLGTMFSKQPPENGNGMTDDQLIQIAVDAGYTDPKVAQDIRDGKYVQWVKDETKAVFATGLQSTPTVYVNGTQVQDAKSLMSPGGMTSVIENAAK